MLYLDIVNALFFDEELFLYYSPSTFDIGICDKNNINIHNNTYIFLSLFVMAATSFFATFDRTYVNGFHIFAMIAGIACSILIFAVFMTSLVRLRLHIIFVVIFFTLNFACAGSILISAWKMNQEYMSIQAIVCIVIGIIIVLAQFVTILNPRLTLNIKAEEQVNENGEKVMVRPKWVVIAFTEWFHIFLFIMNMINITILTFIP